MTKKSRQLQKYDLKIEDSSKNKDNLNNKENEDNTRDEDAIPTQNNNS